MKFCYIDESGIGDIKKEPYAVMAGVIADAYRMDITKKEWENFLGALSSIIKRPITEIHTRDFYSGNGIWRNIEGEKRAEIIDLIFQWLNNRKHELVFTAVDRKLFNTNFNKEKFAQEINISCWCFMALHICLAIQKYAQGYNGSKGHTLLIFDNEDNEAKNFINIIRKPPKWTETYYKREKKIEPFNKIIDVPYFGDSRHVSLIQLADWTSFFIRKYIELKMGCAPDYEDETNNIQKWGDMIFSRAIESRFTFMKSGRCECADLFYKYAPSCIL